jgi:hypothetical protein
VREQHTHQRFAAGHLDRTHVVFHLVLPGRSFASRVAASTSRCGVTRT